MKIKYFTLSVLLGLTMFSCSKKTVPTTDDYVDIYIDEHNSQNSLDWMGIYSGNLKGKDGQSHQVNLRLLDNGVYVIQVDGGEESTGVFSWSKEGQKIELGGVSQFDSILFVGENFISQIDKKGNFSRTGKGVLSKKNVDLIVMDIENVQWELVEVNGNDLSKYGEQMKTPGFLFNATDKRLQGNAGCNSMGAGYNIKMNNEIEFSHMFSTKMACPNMELETEVSKSFSKVSHYNINKDMELMLLNEDGDVVMKFIASE